MSEEKSRSYLPHVWSDDVRMNVMFKKFRVKSLNPVGWNDQMEFWMSAIMDYCKTCKKVIITHQEICDAFERNKRLPECIDIVLQHMEQTSKIETGSKFQKTRSDWLTWGINTLTKDVFSWAYSSVQSYFYTPPPERYIVVDIAKNMAAKVLKKYKETQSTEKSVFYRDKFYEEFKDICGHEVNVDIVLTLLEESKEITIHQTDGNTVIKFKEQKLDGNLKKAEVKSAKQLTDIDRSVLKLEQAIEDVEQEINRHQDTITNLEKAIKETLKTSRPKAMMLLKKKKQFEATVSKKLATLDNLEKLLDKVRNTESDKLVVDAYKTASNALNKSLKGSLHLDKVDDIMDELAQAMDDANEIQTTLAKLGGAEVDDMDELEDELKELMEEDDVKIKTSKESSLIDALEQLEVMDDSPDKNKQSKVAGVL